MVIKITNSEHSEFFKNVSLYSSFALTIFLLYNVVFRFFLYEHNKILFLKKISQFREWFKVTWIILKTIFGSTEDMYGVITKYLWTIKNTPQDLWIGPYHLVYVNKPEDLQVVLNSSNSMEKGLIYKFLKRGLGEGLITGPVHKWKKNRKLISPIFSSRNLENYFGIFNLRGRELVKKLKKYSDTGEYFDLWVPVSTTTFSVVWEIGIGTDTCIDETEKEDFVNAILMVSEAYSLRIFRLWLYPVFVFKLWLKLFGYWKHFDSARYIPHRMLARKKEAYYEKKKLLQAQNKLEDYPEPLIDKFLQLNDEGAGLSDNDICNELTTLIVAGSETNAITISLTLIMLAINPHIQEKVYQEIIRVLGEKDKEIDPNDILKMEYLDQCIKETMRVFPPIPFLLRLATGDVKINESCTVRAGTHIIIPPIMVHKDPDIYPNPEVYNPDNFSAEQMEKRHKYGFLAFSGGPRGCIGGKYAVLAIKVLLALIIKEYSVSTEATMEDMKMKLEIICRSANGYKIKFHSRKRKEESCSS